MMSLISNSRPKGKAEISILVFVIEQVALIQIWLETLKPNFIAMELIISPYIFRRIVNDSLRTDVCLLYPPYLIALGKFF